MAFCDAHADAESRASAPQAKEATPSCGLCGAALTGPTVATSSGDRVHIACADRAARRAWRVRRAAATLHGLCIVGVVTWLAGRGVEAMPLFSLLIAWLAAHWRLHWRFWHYLGRDLRRRLRR